MPGISVLNTFYILTHITFLTIPLGGILTPILQMGKRRSGRAGHAATDCLVAEPCFSPQHTLPTSQLLQGGLNRGLLLGSTCPPTNASAHLAFLTRSDAGGQSCGYNCQEGFFNVCFLSYKRFVYATFIQWNTTQIVKSKNVLEEFSMTWGDLHNTLK